MARNFGIAQHDDVAARLKRDAFWREASTITFSILFALSPLAAVLGIYWLCTHLLALGSQ